MKKILILIMLASVALSCRFECSATGEQKVESYGQNLEDELFSLIDDDTLDALESFGMDSLNISGIYDISIKSITNFFSESLLSGVKSALKNFFVLLSLIIILVCISALAGSSKYSDCISLAAVCVVTLNAAKSLNPIISTVASSMHVTAQFMKGYIPVYAGIIAFSGNPASALTYNSLLFGLSEMISAFSNYLCVDIIGMFFCLSIAFSISENVNGNRFIGGVNRVMGIVLGLISTLFTGLLSIRSVLASSLDSVSQKGARFLMSSLIPIVGGAMSEAYSSILGSINLIKGSVAVIGIAVVAVLNIPVILEALIYYASFNALSIAAEVLDSQKVSLLFRSFASGIRFLLLLSVFEMFVLIISTGIMLSLKGGS